MVLAQHPFGDDGCLGEITLKGEIVDSKCYLGVMNPGLSRPIGPARSTAFKEEFRRSYCCAIEQGEPATCCWSGRDDEYDLHYLHLFLWDKSADAVAGAYRVGRTDLILAEHGPQEISPRLESIEQVSARVAESEPDGKGVPVLLRHYLKLNATLLEFNVDPEFANCLDALVMVDLRSAPAAMLKRYMGKAAYRSFVAE
jgi:hypothetical protein